MSGPPQPRGELSETLLENYEHLQPAFGSHNLRSLTHALVMAREMRVPERAYELQMLYGMAEPLREREQETAQAATAQPAATPATARRSHASPTRSPTA